MLLETLVTWHRGSHVTRYCTAIDGNAGHVTMILSIISIFKLQGCVRWCIYLCMSHFNIGQGSYEKNCIDFLDWVDFQVLHEEGNPPTPWAYADTSLPDLLGRPSLHYADRAFTMQIKPPLWSKSASTIQHSFFKSWFLWVMKNFNNFFLT